MSTPLEKEKILVTLEYDVEYIGADGRDYVLSQLDKCPYKVGGMGPKGSFYISRGNVVEKVSAGKIQS